jgi:hypothetical protein
MKVIKSIYNFIVGDMIILIGVTLTVIVLVLINSLTSLASLRIASGIILIAAVLISLTATLYREARGNR